MRQNKTKKTVPGTGTVRSGQQGVAVTFERSKMFDYAEEELHLLCSGTQQGDNRPILESYTAEILHLIYKISQTTAEQSSQVTVTIKVISDALLKLAQFMPLTPLTGASAEWHPPLSKGGIAVNKRCQLVERSRGGDIYFKHAVLFVDSSGGVFEGTAIMPDGSTLLHSTLYVKSFPFTPRTFTVRVLKTEIAANVFEMHIKDGAQLKEVFEYYLPNITPRSPSSDK